MKPKVFIDGREGTTGLQIHNRLTGRSDIELLSIDDELRKDVVEREKLLNEADLVFLCLPDTAAFEAVSLVHNDKTKIIDASTAHRTSKKWAYGFPELSKEHLDRIADSRFVANPGCHATGIIAASYPLIKLGIMPLDYPLCAFSITGYSGGGKAMIHSYSEEKTFDMFAPRMYALDLKHKHLPEIMYVTGLNTPPLFCPVVDDYYAGIATTIMLHRKMLCVPQTAIGIRDILSEYYQYRYSERSHQITVARELGSGMLSGNWGVDSNAMKLTVSGNDDLIIVTAQFDNLGKGASGAAVQNMEIMLN